MTAIADPRQSVNSSVYDISPGATSTDVRELLEVKLMHLEAMLVMTWGVGGETFRNKAPPCKTVSCGPATRSSRSAANWPT
jgi:hypothetical protein